MIVMTSDLYIVRSLILNQRPVSMSLQEIDALIEHNARSEFVDYVAYERVMEALRNGTDREAERGNRSMH